MFQQDGEPLSEGVTDWGVNGSTFFVQHAKASDSGEYVCQFKNLLDTTRQSFLVEVNEPALGTGYIVGIIIAIIIVIVLFALLARRIYLDRVNITSSS